MFNTYEDIRAWREETISSVEDDPQQLNAFHDQVMYQTVKIAKGKVESEQGEVPAPFAFFLMGSAGRYEQSLWSDQDHGLLFEGDHQPYFLKLGEEISDGLAVVGYPYCEGKVMASNPLWCQSLDSFNEQMEGWLSEADWSSLRNFSIFFDSRVLMGEKQYLLGVKKKIFSYLSEHPDLYPRFVDNVQLIKKGVGVFGQLLPEQQGEREGSMNIKQTAYFPYVNALRMLALLRGESGSSTLTRFEAMKDRYPSVAEFEKDFHQLLAFRLRHQRASNSYEGVHLLPVKELSKEDKHQLKKMIKHGNKLFSTMKTILKKEGVL
ncbi:DUF294 nucleotidyltransferase-like domain-containing protein [Halobacillus litoralis]|uniref:DUF294 nucleotidyltransferase-like domain-containing protein n=1 Tax=Halobacillus litoralis TaxID=45668 RepID=UPI001CD7F59E|nr:DUF294 nucleotidyltransferase-like domain-containing protein [Halobacillus litoralis]MCA0972499.1 DUF294 nucleotidyltransferase-like domain-containing protein [Halobacillus litoralis]